MARALGIDDSVTTCDCCGKSGAPLDWGGAVVRGRDYEILSDTQGH